MRIAALEEGKRMGTDWRSLVLSGKLGIGVWLGFVTLLVNPALGLPPVEDTPEEILRTEIIIDARSPVDGKPLSPAEYAELQAQLEASPPLEPKLSPEVRKTIGLLRLRRFIRTFFPFLLR